MRKAFTFGDRLFTVEGKVANLREHLDYFKSSVEIAPEQVTEFHEWKRRHVVSQTPLVSVCIATYNRAAVLTTRSLPSVLGQSYENLEVIVVGDGCTDETEDLVAGFDDSRLTFVNRPKRGSYPANPLRRWMVAGTDAMNDALSRVRGEFVTHLDDDDEYLPDRLTELVAFARQTQADLVWHPFWYEVEPGNWKLKKAESFSFEEVTTSSVFYRSWFSRIEWNPAAHMVMEPGDWNRMRRIKYFDPVARRYPKPLLRHYRERGQLGT